MTKDSIINYLDSINKINYHEKKNLNKNDNLKINSDKYMERKDAVEIKDKILGDSSEIHKFNINNDVFLDKPSNEKLDDIRIKTKIKLLSRVLKIENQTSPILKEQEKEIMHEKINNFKCCLLKIEENLKNDLNKQISNFEENKKKKLEYRKESNEMTSNEVKLELSLSNPFNKDCTNLLTDKKFSEEKLNIRSLNEELDKEIEEFKIKHLKEMNEHLENLMEYHTNEIHSFESLVDSNSEFLDCLKEDMENQIYKLKLDYEEKYELGIINIKKKHNFI